MPHPSRWRRLGSPMVKGQPSQPIRIIDTLKIKQTPLSDILEPRIWGLGSFSLKKPKVSQFVNGDGDHARTPKCTEG